MRNIWEPFGLSSTPFFDQPLEPSRDSPYPITLYVERGPEGRILNRIASSENSVSVIEGLPGGGKTTFIHYLKFRGSENNYAVSPSHVRVTSKFTYREFALETLTNMLRPIVNHPDGAIRRAAMAVAEIEEAVSVVNQAARGGGAWSIQLRGDVGGAGGGIGVGREGPAVEPPPLENARLFSMARAVAGAIRDKLGHRGVIVHVNNLELAGMGDITWPAVLFNDVRDFLQIPGIHFLVGASRGFVAEHLAGHARVYSILQHPVDLPPLEADQVQLVLERRYENLTIPGKEVVQPVSREAVVDLHAAYNGDLRAMFNALEDAMERRLEVQPRPAGFVEIMGLLKDDYAEATLRDLPKAANAAVQRLATMARPFTQADFKRMVKKSQPRVSQIFAELQALDVIVQLGGSRPYKYDFSGKAKIALGLLPR